MRLHEQSPRRPVNHQLALAAGTSARQPISTVAFVSGIQTVGVSCVIPPCGSDMSRLRESSLACSESTIFSSRCQKARSRYADGSLPSAYQRVAACVQTLPFRVSGCSVRSQVQHALPALQASHRAGFAELWECSATGQPQVGVAGARTVMRFERHPAVVTDILQGARPRRPGPPRRLRRRCTARCR